MVVEPQVGVRIHRGVGWRRRNHSSVARGGGRVPHIHRVEECCWGRSLGDHMGVSCKGMATKPEVLQWGRNPE